MRVSSNYKDIVLANRLIIGLSCIWIAAKFLLSRTYPLSTWVNVMEDILPGLQARFILLMEKRIVSLLRGIIYQNRLYLASLTEEDFSYFLNNIILASDPAIYAQEVARLDS